MATAQTDFAICAAAIQSVLSRHCDEPFLWPAAVAYEGLILAFPASWVPLRRRQLLGDHHLSSILLQSCVS